MIYKLFHCDDGRKILSHSFVDLDTAKKMLPSKPFNIVIMDEDEDFPGVFDLMSNKGVLFTLEPEDFVE